MIWIFFYCSSVLLLLSLLEPNKHLLPLHCGQTWRQHNYCVTVCVCLQALKLKEQRHQHQNGVEIQLRVMLASSLQRLII